MWEVSFEGVRDPLMLNHTAAAFKDLNATLGVTYDRYIRTTDAQHKANCQRVWGVAAGKGEMRDEQLVKDVCAGVPHFTKQ